MGIKNAIAYCSKPYFTCSQIHVDDLACYATKTRSYDTTALLLWSVQSGNVFLLSCRHKLVDLCKQIHIRVNTSMEECLYTWYSLQLFMRLGRIPDDGIKCAH